MRIAVSGLVAQYPLGGVAWDYLQYTTGLARLGHDVWYVEDTGQWPYDPRTRGTAEAWEFNVAWLDDAARRFELEDRWAYRDPRGRWHGIPETEREELLGSTELVLNVSGVLRDPTLFAGARLAFIDSDPVFTQIKLARGQRDFRALVDAHDVHFSFGEALSESPSVPETGHRWRPTRQPVLLDAWRTTDEPRGEFTTIMNWTSYKAVEHDGVSFGQKDVEFDRFRDLPAMAPEARFELALAEGKTRRAPRDDLRRRGWRVVDPNRVCPGADDYRRYIQRSAAEWSVAKNAYVRGGSGWFSGRSACYLAAGRPVVVQETGFSEILPTGEGLLSFRTPGEAVEGVRRVMDDYDRHRAAALEVAERFFDADRVLSRLVEEATA